MHEFGEDVEHLKDHFPEDATDAEWLPYLGQKEYFLITRDEAIRWKPAELEALRKHKVGAFFLGGKNLNRCMLIEQLVRNWRRIKEFAAKEKRPFGFRVPPHGARFTNVKL